MRVLGRSGHNGRLSPGMKTAILFGVLAAIAAAVAWFDPRPSLRHVRVTMLSGSPTGNYFATVDRLAEEVARRKGRVTNVSTAGSVENLQRLIAGMKQCDVHFGLVQDGIAFPDKHRLELVGRMPHPESLIILGVRRIASAPPPTSRACASASGRWQRHRADDAPRPGGARGSRACRLHAADRPAAGHARARRARPRCHGHRRRGQARC